MRARKRSLSVFDSGFETRPTVLDCSQPVTFGTLPDSFGFSQFCMSAAKCSAFLMASDRLNPGGSLLAWARSSAAPGSPIVAI
jgi:hypothetical protein